MKSNYLKAYVFFLFVTILSFSKAQIVDDSTHLNYGLKSTHYYTYDDIFKDSIHTKQVDSTFFDQHYFDGTYSNGEYYQNLGNSITPRISLWFNPQINITQQLAPERFNYYRDKKERFYDTKSPYTFLKYTQGIRGDQILEGLFTQNINPNWNIGFDFYRGVDKVQFASNGLDHRLSETWDFRGFTAYNSLNKKYKLLLNFETQNSSIEEQWGIKFDDLDAETIDFTIVNSLSTIANNTFANSEQKYKQIDIFQKYNLVESKIGIYMKNKFTRDKRIYNDKELELNYSIDTVKIDTVYTFDTTGVTPMFYDNLYFSTDTTMDVRLFDAFENELGLYYIGQNWDFTIGFLNQDFGYSNNYETSKIYGSEHIITNELNIILDKKVSLNSINLYNLNNEYSSTNSISTNVFDFSYNSSLSKPFLVDNYYLSNHMKWKNSFKNIFSNQFDFKVNYTHKNITFSSHSSYSVVKNYVYYAENFTPQQLTKAINIIQFKNKIKYKYKALNLEQTVVYAQSSTDAVRVPALLLHSKVFFAGKLFNKSLNAQVGVEGRYLSSYKAYGYIPLIQNFGLQDEFTVYNYPLIDVFANFQIQTVDFFIKVGHSTEDLIRPGYFSTPYYPAKKFNVTFGIKWRFFD